MQSGLIKSGETKPRPTKMCLIRPRLRANATCANERRGKQPNRNPLHDDPVSRAICADHALAARIAAPDGAHNGSLLADPMVYGAGAGCGTAADRQQRDLCVRESAGCAAP